MKMYYTFLVFFGMAGAMSRYALDLLINAGHFPLATLMINLLGCFLLAFVTVFLAGFSKLPSKLISAIGTGFIGSFTTFSAFALESAELIQTGSYLSAAVYISGSLFGGLLFGILGYQAGGLLLTIKGGKKHAD